MRLTPCALALVVTATATACAGPYYGDRYGYGYSSPGYYSPNYAYRSYSPGYSPNYAYAPQYSNETPASRYVGYSSQWDYYRNYRGTYHPGPEVYP